MSIHRKYTIASQLALYTNAQQDLISDRICQRLDRSRSSFKKWRIVTIDHPFELSAFQLKVIAEELGVKPFDLINRKHYECTS